MSDKGYAEWVRCKYCEKYRLKEDLDDNGICPLCRFIVNKYLEDIKESEDNQND